MINQNEADEHAYLDTVLVKLSDALEQAEESIEHSSQKIMDTKRYIWENSAELDSVERAANRISAHEEATRGDKAIVEREKLKKLIKSPYFGRIDFQPDRGQTGGEQGEQALYIGVHAFSDAGLANDIIFDWRAPVSSMFYDYETGAAAYTAPSGEIFGNIRLKRQYRIKNSRMEFMIESSLNIGDDILQKELSQHSDEKMKNIVATIQREQNAIIRNETAKVLILQGAAGSGKTSIALHRVAFLLYRYKQVLTSGNIMILSPNKVFGNYISNVLPELGEENILELGFEQLADELLGKKCRRQTFSQQVERLLEGCEPSFIERISFKATNDFVDRLRSFLAYADRHYFRPADLEIGFWRVTKEELAARYQSLRRYPIKVRLEKIADDLAAQHLRRSAQGLDAKSRRQMKTAILKMFSIPSALALYKHFYKRIQKTDYFVTSRQEGLEFCDVYPLIYVKLFYEGTTRDYRPIKHLLVDEMQDYTPIQYQVVARLFSCKMTILGDCNQSVNPYSSSTSETIRPYFENCDCVELRKSYRSTLEITKLAQSIQENRQLIPIERHGEAPSILHCADEDGQFQELFQLADAFSQGPFSTLGILCRTQKRARQLYAQMKGRFSELCLLDYDSSEFREGIVITTTHMSKGLEFDQVIVPDVSSAQYSSRVDQSLLYIACTRAMHKLDLTYTGEKSGLLPV